MKALRSKGDASDQAAGEDHEPEVEQEIQREEAPYSEWLFLCFVSVASQLLVFRRI